MRARALLYGLIGLLTAVWCVGMFGRVYWTPDEPREADIAWRMSWQPDKAVPLLAGEAFCEKPPLTYWVAGVSMAVFGKEGWSARIPNLLYALITALSVGLLGARLLSARAGVVAAAVMSSMLLSYQVAIWFATDAPLLAFVSLALLGLQIGFYAPDSRTRLGGYSLMHAALALAFLSKSAAGWMVPALAFITLVVWERRWRELLRVELYAGLIVQLLMIGAWTWAVYAGPDGLAHLKTFFWNNLVGRFARIDAPPELQYATGHTNSPGKYLRELPVYLFPWTLLALAALGRLWRDRAFRSAAAPALRFATAVFLPSFVLLSFAATARNIYIAPVLPGIALLVAWWADATVREPAPSDRWALRATAVVMLLSATLMCAAALVAGEDAWDTLPSKALFVGVTAAGLAAAAYASVHAWAVVYRPALAQRSLFLAWAALFIAPLSQLYQVADGWQDLPQIARAVAEDSAGRPLLLVAADETTRATIDMYARPEVILAPAPTTPETLGQLRDALRSNGSVALTQLPGRMPPRNPQLAVRFRMKAPVDPAWLAGSDLTVLHRYQLPNGRRYALLGAPAD